MTTCAPVRLVQPLAVDPSRSVAAPGRRAAVLAALVGLLGVLVAPVAEAGSGAGAGAAGVAQPTSAGVVPGLDPGLALDRVQSVIVTGAGDVASVVQRAGGRVTAELPFVGGVAADVPGAALASVAADPAVRAVTADREVRLVDYTWDDSTVASNFARTTQATTAWTGGNYGKGVGVAVIDTGVSSMPDLNGRLVHGPDLSGEGTTVDNYGHGTVMAGLIAGNGTDSKARTGGAFTGTAPAAHVVSIKVAGRNGVVDVSTMLQAMHWVSAYRQQYGIRVLNLAWGVPSTQSPSLDPLNYAVQRLWREGVVVVVAAGNSGPSNGTVTKPGDDPVVLTVGAYNDQGDTDPANDNVASWSSRGPTAAGVSKPDVVAPGRTVVASRSYGSHIEATYPKALVSPSYIKGSGTSQASAITSGAVALLLAARPELTPDQVKDLLRRTASPIAGYDATSQGAGRVQLGAALTATPTTATQAVTAGGLGSINASRAGRYVVADCGGVKTEINGEIDVRCQPWDPRAWTTSGWTADSWTGASWAGSEWTGVTWKGAAWSDAAWSGSAWSGGTWNSGSWYGATPWNGSTVSSSAWTGVTWKDSTWSGVTWKSSDFTTGDWESHHYDDAFLTSFWGPQPPAGQIVPGEPFTPRRPADRKP